MQIRWMIPRSHFAHRMSGVFSIRVLRTSHYIYIYFIKVQTSQKFKVTQTYLKDRCSKELNNHVRGIHMQEIECLGYSICLYFTAFSTLLLLSKYIQVRKFGTLKSALTRHMVICSPDKECRKFFTKTI